MSDFSINFSHPPFLDPLSQRGMYLYLAERTYFYRESTFALSLGGTFPLFFLTLQSLEDLEKIVKAVVKGIEFVGGFDITTPAGKIRAVNPFYNSNFSALLPLPELEDRFWLYWAIGEGKKLSQAQEEELRGLLAGKAQLERVIATEK